MIMDNARQGQAHELSHEQRQNARRLLKQLLKGTCKINSSLPDTGPLDYVMSLLFEAYCEAGPSVIPAQIRAQMSDYPILEHLSKKSRYEPMKISELLQLPDPKWILSGILYEDALAVVYGLPGSKKSFLVLDWMIHIALKRYWQGRPTMQCRVIYLAAEGARGYRRRIQAWCHHYQIDPEALEHYLLFVPVELPLQNTGEVHSFIDTIQDTLADYDDELPCIIIIDTLFACAPGVNTNSPDVMSAIAYTARTIKSETEATNVLIVHHSGKDKTKGMTGNTALGASIDVAYQIEVDADGNMAVTSSKVKDDEDVTIYLKTEKVVYGNGDRDNSLVIVAGEKPEKKIAFTANQQKILDALPDTEPGTRFADILQTIELTDGKAMRNQTLAENLKKLEDLKIINKTSQGRYYKQNGISEGDDE